MSMPSPMVGARTSLPRYFKGKEYDEFCNNLQSKFESIQSTALRSQSNTGLMEEKVKEVFGLASKTTKYTEIESDVEMRLETYQKLFAGLRRRFITLWEMIAEDFDDDTWLFFVASQGAMIEKGELLLVKEKRKRQEQGNEFDNLEQQVSKVAKKLQNVKHERFQTDQNIENLKVDLRNMQWSNSNGVGTETSDRETEISEGETDPNGWETDASEGDTVYYGSS
jgi:hypothetical protein